MSETPPGGVPPDDLTPPGPPTEPTGGLSVDDWIAARQAQPVQHPEQRLNPYVAAPPTARPEWREFDRTSLWAFLLALTWVGAPIAAVLGFLGLRRTADGTRVGRWAAVVGVLLGLVGTLGVVAGAAGAAWFRDSFKSVGRVEAGECVDVDDSDGVSFDIRDCDEQHQAEVVAAGDLDSSAYDTLVHGSAAELCFELIGEPYRSAARTGGFLVTVVIDAPADRPGVGDAFACYFESADGRSLSGRIDGSTEEGNV